MEDPAGQIVVVTLVGVQCPSPMPKIHHKIYIYVQLQPSTKYYFFKSHILALTTLITDYRHTHLDVFPKLDLLAISSTDTEGHGELKVCPVDPPGMTIQHVLHRQISLVK